MCYCITNNKNDNDIKLLIREEHINEDVPDKYSFMTRSEFNDTNSYFRDLVCSVVHSNLKSCLINLMKKLKINDYQIIKIKLSEIR